MLRCVTVFTIMGAITGFMGRSAVGAEMRFGTPYPLAEINAPLPDEPYSNERLICLLSNCASEKFRDPARAAAIAERLLSRADTNGPMWLYLALAHYRAGDFSAAEEAVRQSMELRSGGDALDWLLLSAAQHKSSRVDNSPELLGAQDSITRRAPIFYCRVGVLGYQRIHDEVQSMPPGLDR